MSGLRELGAGLVKRAAGFTIPPWLPWVAGILALSAALSFSYGVGRVHEARIGAKELADYKTGQAAQTVKVIEKQIVVQTVVETKYRDRIKKIYVQGERIETLIPQYITPIDVDRFGVNAGFVRLVDAAWAGVPPGPAVDADREPVGISIDYIAGIQTANATAARAWREQALAWREFYARQQVAVNGKAGAWAHESAGQEPLPPPLDD